MGYAVVEHGPTITVLNCGVLRLSESQNHADRLVQIFETVKGLIMAYKPIAVSVETPVYGKDPLAMLKLGRAQASCILAAKLHDVETYEYYPKMIKKSVTGNGNATKDQVARMLELTVQFKNTSLPKDATDALATAWCHIQQNKLAQAPIPIVKRRKQDQKTAWHDFVHQNKDRIRS
jgi:crossover junction endodeoxyribonuclease RuvC